MGANNLKKNFSPCFPTFAPLLATQRHEGITQKV